MRRKVGIKIETFMGAGHYQHKVYDIGINARNRREIAVPENVVDLLKKANEAAYDAMPQGSSPVVSRLSYKIPRK